MAYGYRLGEVPLPRPDPIKAGTRISEPKEVDLTKRPPRAVSLGVHVDGAALPRPDNHDPLTSRAGVEKRFARAPPKPRRQITPGRPSIRGLRRFVRKWLRANLVKLAAASDTSVLAWLDKCPYPLHRKQELLEKWKKVFDIWNPKYKKCKSFQKTESYPEYKHSRGINSRTDEFKCMVGPIFKLIEEQLYKHPAFIKHVPVADRPAYIREMLYRSGAKYIATDYTSFEALFTAEIMESVEFELYDYMTQDLPEHGDFMRMVREVLGGINHCVFKDFWVDLEATRMSGEMCTSLGNGFSNLMFMLYVCECIGATEVAGVVEGDDGLFVFKGTAPTAQDFADLGLIIKLEVHNRLEEASFCGLIFDPEDLVNVTDPIAAVADAGWTDARYATAGLAAKLGLLRCIGLSLAHQYPGCPIIQSFAWYVLRVTAGANVEKALANGPWNTYDRTQLLLAYKDRLKIAPRDVPANTRSLVSRKYGISVEDQLNIENHFDQLTVIMPVRCEAFLRHTPAVWHDYAARYVREWYPDDASRAPGLPLVTGGPDREFRAAIAPEDGMRKPCRPKRPR